jgi:SNF2 family DNA or RNA helicase
MTSRILSFDKDRFVLEGQPRDSQRMSVHMSAQALPGDEARWAMPDTYESELQLGWADYSTTDKAQGRSEFNVAYRNERLRRQEEVDTDYHSRATELQNRGIGWLVSGNGILADEMGTGKTVMACVAADVLVQRGHVLIVTTKSTVGSWADHINRWTSSKALVLHGTPAERAEQIAGWNGEDWIVTTHGMMLKHSDIANWHHLPFEESKDNFLSSTSWNLMVVDEFHKFRDPKGLTARALKQTRKVASKAWALSGSPIEDNPDDLWHALNFVDPTNWPTRGRFRDRFCDMEQPFHGGLVNKGVRPEMQEEFDAMVKPVFLRRMRAEVWPDLPLPRDTDYREIPMSPAQAKAYKQLSKEMMTSIDGNLLMSTDPITIHTRLDFISTGVPLVNDDGDIVGINPKGSNKLEAIQEIAEGRAGDPFVIYAPSRKVIDMLYAALSEDYKCARITGSVSLDERTASVELFQAGKLDIMLMTSAGGEGITLTAADLVVYCDLDWSARMNQQVADRIDRKGQYRAPQRIVLMSADTIDVSRRYLVAKKEEGQQAILRDVDRLKDVINGNVNTE